MSAVTALIRKVRLRMRKREPTQKRPVGLPPELWSIIFEYAVLWVTFDFSGGTAENKSIPLGRLDSDMFGVLVVSHVCRRWRAIALSTPHLWCAATLKDTLKALPDILARSGALPLSLLLPKCDLGHTAALVAECSRWRHIRMDLTQEALRLFQTTPPLRLPVLQTLCLELSVKAMHELNRIRAFEDAPMLSHLSLVLDCSSTRDCLVLSGVWRRLTHLVLTRRDGFLDCIDALNQCPALRSLHLIFVYDALSSDPRFNPHYPSPSQTLKLPQLETLRLCAPDVGACFTLLDLPALEELDVVSLGNAMCPVEALPVFTERTKCHLRKLGLYFLKCNLRALERVLLCYPSLVALQLSSHGLWPAGYINLDDEFIDFLTHPKRQASREKLDVLPGLQSINIFHCNGFSADAMTKMIKSRRAGLARYAHLATVHVHSQGPREGYDMIWAYFPSHAEFGWNAHVTKSYLGRGC